MESRLRLPVSVEADKDVLWPNGLAILTDPSKQAFRRCSPSGPLACGLDESNYEQNATYGGLWYGMSSDVPQMPMWPSSEAVKYVPQVRM